MAGIDSLLSGDFFTAVFYPFINAGISLEIMYLILIGMAMLFTYYKSKKLEYVSLVLFLTSSVLMPLVSSQFQRYWFILMLFGVVSLLYSLFKSED
jgi:hypothetical protein